MLGRVVVGTLELPENDIVYSQDHKFGLRGIPPGVWAVEQGGNLSVLWFRAPGYGVHGNDEQGRSMYGDGTLAVSTKDLPAVYREQLDLDPRWRLEYLPPHKGMELLQQFWLNYSGGCTVQAASDLYDQLRPYFDIGADDAGEGEG